MSNATGPEAHLADEVLQLLVEMSGRLGQYFAARAAEFGLSAAEAKVLLALEPGEAVSMRAIARKLDYDASNLTRVVDKLEGRDAVERCPNPSDRRVKGIIATQHGVDLSERLSSRLHADAGPVRTLTDSQLRDLRTLLRHAMELDPK